MESEAFPRGRVPPGVTAGDKGGHNGTLISNKRAKDKLHNLFETTDAKVKPEKKDRKRLATITAEDAKLLDGKRRKNTERVSFQVVQLSYDQLVPDMLSLGVVHEIYHNSMIIVLPGRATGKVHVTDISNPYNKLLKKYQAALENGKSLEDFHSHRDMFTIGQVVVVKVTGTGKNERGTDVQLSLNPQDVHSNYNAAMVHEDLILVGAIKSREDKGFQVDLGIANVIAFLLNEEVQEKVGSLKIGQLVYCKVTKISKSGDRRSVQVTTNIGKIASQNYNKDGAVNYSALLPGMILSTIVEKSHESGLKLSCFSLEGLVHSDHMKDEWTKPDSVEEATEVMARVLYIHPNLTTPYLTMQADLVPMKSIIKKEDRNKIGSIQSVRVVSCSSRGVMVRFADGGEKGFLSLNHLGDGMFSTKEDIAKKFKPKLELECRVLKYAHFERMYFCSLTKALLKADILTVGQAKPGERVKCTVTGVNTGGVEVTFGRSLRGFIPKSILGCKSWLKKPDDATGKVVTGRIMSIEVDKKRVLIATKKELVKSDGAVISSSSDASVGAVGHAIVQCVTTGGALFKALGGMKGFIPVGHFRLPKVDGQYADIKEHVKIGDILQYVVREVKNGQLIASPHDGDEEDYEMELKEKDTKKEKKKKRKRADSEDTVASVESANSSDVENSEKRKKKKKNKKKKKKAKDIVETGSSPETPVVDVCVDEIKQESEEEELPKMDLDGGNFWEEFKTEEYVPENTERNLTETTIGAMETEKKSSDSGKGRVVDAATKQVVEKYEKQGIGEDGKEARYWLKLMTHYVSEGLPDKARAVAREGLEYGPIAQNSSHALKLFKALFVLELQFGTEDTVKGVLKDALQRTDNKYECYKMAALTYEKEGQIENAINLYRNHITKECGDKVDGWINFARLYFEKGQVEDARDVFHAASKQAAVRKLDEVNLTSRFAILEVYFGDITKGCLLLDTLLQRLPHRADIWNVYVQAVIKKEDFDKAREVFVRAFEIEWKPQKIKSLLTAYKNFEEQHGNEETKRIFAQAAVKVLHAEGFNVVPSAND